MHFSLAAMDIIYAFNFQWNYMKQNVTNVSVYGCNLSFFRIHVEVIQNFPLYMIDKLSLES